MGSSGFMQLQLGQVFLHVISHLKTRQEQRSTRPWLYEWGLIYQPFTGAVLRATKTLSTLTPSVNSTENATSTALWISSSATPP